jgi:phosphoserine phosphatase
MTNPKAWQPKSPIKAISFDCDNTLTTIEGIEAIASMNDCATEVHDMTFTAMTETGLSKELYKKRIELVSPSRTHMTAAAKIYADMKTPDIEEVISTLRQLKKEIYVISAGLNPAISDFANTLGIASNNCFAVDTSFNEDGSYAGFDEDSILIKNDGKNQILNKIKTQHGSVVHIGDGMNDICAQTVADRFIGFGGHVRSKNVEQASPFYITSKSMLTLLPLVLTADEAKKLNKKHKAYYDEGCSLLANNLSTSSTFEASAY